MKFLQFECIECHKKYKTIRGAYLHNEKKHDGKIKFMYMREL